MPHSIQEEYLRYKTWASRQPGKTADTLAADVLRNNDMGEMFQNAEHIQDVTHEMHE